MEILRFNCSQARRPYRVWGWVAPASCRRTYLKSRVFTLILARATNLALLGSVEARPVGGEGAAASPALWPLKILARGADKEDRALRPEPHCFRFRAPSGEDRWGAIQASKLGGRPLPL